MRSQRVWDGFDVWVIDPSGGNVEQVQLDPAPAALGADETGTAKPPRATPEKPRRKSATRAKTTERPRAKTSAAKPRAAKRRLAPKTALPVVKRAAGTKKRASLRKPVRAKKKRVRALEPVHTATTATIASPTPRPKRVKQPTPAASPAPAHSPAPATSQPVLVASAADLTRPLPVNEADALMVLELVSGGPAQRPSDGPPPRRGTIDIRFVDVHE